jgi:hypothetical protein
VKVRRRTRLGRFVLAPVYDENVVPGAFELGDHGSSYEAGTPEHYHAHAVRSLAPRW